MKSLCTFALLVGLAAGIGAQPAARPMLPTDFSITLSDLHRAAASGDDSRIPADRLLVIHGDIGSVTVHEDGETEFVAEVELVGGAWSGDADVELHRVYVVFEGIRFRDAFSRRSPGRLQSGKTLLVLGSYLGLGVDYDETTAVAVVEAVDFRPVD